MGVVAKNSSPNRVFDVGERPDLNAACGERQPGWTDDGVEAREARIAVNARGNVYLAWIGPEGLPRIASSTDQGETWNPARTVLAPVCGHPIPCECRGRPGGSPVSYYGTTDTNASPQRWDA